MGSRSPSNFFHLPLYPCDPDDIAFLHCSTPFRSPGLLFPDSTLPVSQHMSSVLTEPGQVALAEVDHHRFNLAVWDHLCSDPQLVALDYRIETDRHGQLIMSPPPAPSHGNRQSEICFLLRKLSASGKVISECPVSTVEGVKAADNAWCSDEVWESLGEAKCFVTCPELLVEVLSPSNTRGEIEEKKRLYFECGAIEVWICASDGKLTFYQGKNSTLETSRLFPEFPDSIP